MGLPLLVSPLRTLLCGVFMLMIWFQCFLILWPETNIEIRDSDTFSTLIYRILISNLWPNILKPDTARQLTFSKETHQWQPLYFSRDKVTLSTPVLKKIGAAITELFWKMLVPWMCLASTILSHRLKTSMPKIKISKKSEVLSFILVMGQWHQQYWRQSISMKVRQLFFLTFTSMLTCKTKK